MLLHVWPAVSASRNGLIIGIETMNPGKVDCQVQNAATRRVRVAGKLGHDDGSIRKGEMRDGYFSEAFADLALA